MKPIASIIVIIAAILIAAAVSCSVAGRHGAEKAAFFQQQGVRTFGEKQALDPSGKGRMYTTTGIASWYGRKWQGKETASGEAFDHKDLTAAHRTLPFGTKVRVTNLENGKNVVVEVTDRGPNVKRRLIDLSHAAAQAIGLKEDGTGRVRLEAVEWPEEKDSSVSEAGGGFSEK